MSPPPRPARRAAPPLLVAERYDLTHGRYRPAPKPPSDPRPRYDGPRPYKIIAVATGGRSTL